jgi:N-acetyl-gamma-glutamyl-phosphate reductase
MSERHRVAVVGARGHTGSELLRFLGGHPQVEVVLASSRQSAGDEVGHGTVLVFEDVAPDDLAEREADVVFLALPDGAAAPYVEAIAPRSLVIDISADHRFDDDWAYGLPELYRDRVVGSRRIANPGCYATVMQLALAPLVSRLGGVPAVFGVSGYSGAGTTPGPRNDPERLADNLMPYKLVGHNHEREATKHLGTEVRFFPHVHQAFRGLLVTAHIPLADSMAADQVTDMYRTSYADEPLIEIRHKAPELRDGTDLLGVVLGGFAVSEDGRNVVVVGAEDNLLKGAAVQAVQNMNLALGLPELTGIAGN